MLFMSFFNARKRVNQKGIQWNTEGEGIVKGGIILLDRKGKPRYAFPEKMGLDLDIQDLALVMEAMWREGAGGQQQLE
jgi:hypothetical protein